MIANEEIVFSSVGVREGVRVGEGIGVEVDWGVGGWRVAVMLVEGLAVAVRHSAEDEGIPHPEPITRISGTMMRNCQMIRRWKLVFISPLVSYVNYKPLESEAVLYDSNNSTCSEPITIARITLGFPGSRQACKIAYP